MSVEKLVHHTRVLQETGEAVRSYAPGYFKEAKDKPDAADRHFIGMFEHHIKMALQYISAVPVNVFHHHNDYVDHLRFHYERAVEERKAADAALA